MNGNPVPLTSSSEAFRQVVSVSPGYKLSVPGLHTGEAGRAYVLYGHAGDKDLFTAVTVVMSPRGAAAHAFCSSPLCVHSQNRLPLCILFVMSEPGGFVRIDPV